MGLFDSIIRVFKPLARKIVKGIKKADVFSKIAKGIKQGVGKVTKGIKKLIGGGSKAGGKETGKKAVYEVGGKSVKGGGTKHPSKRGRGKPADKDLSMDLEL